VGNTHTVLCLARSIANSIVIIVFLSFMVAMILVRTVYRDIARYNRVPMAEKEDEVRVDWRLGGYGDGNIAC
jgi:hypothetical protein